MREPETPAAVFRALVDAYRARYVGPLAEPAANEHPAPAGRRVDAACDAWRARYGAASGRRVEGKGAVRRRSGGGWTPPSGRVRAGGRGRGGRRDA